MKKLRKWMKGAHIAVAVVRVCVEAYRSAKADADKAMDDALAASDVQARADEEFEPFGIIVAGERVCVIDGTEEVLILDGDGRIN